jgi:hypothetical protein
MEYYKNIFLFNYFLDIDGGLIWILYDDRYLAFVEWKLIIGKFVPDLIS